MAVFTKLLKEDIENFISEYSIGNLDSFEEIVDGIENSNFKIFSSLIESTKNINEIDFNSKCAVIMGTEADSISSDFIEQSNECFKIPMTGNVDSLNLSVSTGIILYEAVSYTHLTLPTIA